MNATVNVIYKWVSHLQTNWVYWQKKPCKMIRWSVLLEFSGGVPLTPSPLDIITLGLSFKQIKKNVATCCLCTFYVNTSISLMVTDLNNVHTIALTSRNDWEPPSHAPVATSSQTQWSYRAVTRQPSNSFESSTNLAAEETFTETLCMTQVIPVPDVVFTLHMISICKHFVCLFSHIDLLGTSVIPLTAAV